MVLSPCGLLEGVSVKHTEAKAVDCERSRSLESGFSIIELLTVVLIVFVVCSMAILQLQPTWQQLQANAGMDQIKASMRQARETAISQRRTIVMTLPAAAVATNCPASNGVYYCAEFYQMVVSGTPPTAVQALQPYLTLPFSNNVQLLSFAGEPDTPDAFVGAGPSVPTGIYAGGVAGAPTSGMQFQSDGTFTDGNGNPIDLSIFLGIQNIPTSARAITILGNTGRVSAYHGTGVAWFK
jgi:type II secretory pathway pseudopilin PulG